MASRRTRIKGIANIPQRRKANATNEDEAKPQVKDEEKSTENNNLTFDGNKKFNIEEPHLQPRPCTDDKLDNKLNDSISQSNTDFKPSDGDISPDISALQSDNSSSDKIANCDVTIINNEHVIIMQENKNVGHMPENKLNNVPQIEQSKPTVIRRKFIKPTVSANIINRKPKENIEKGSRGKSESLPPEKTEETPKEDGKTEVIDLEKDTPSELVLVQNQGIRSDDFKLKQPIPITVSNLNTENEITLDETYLTPQNGVISKPEVPLDKGVKKITNFMNSAQNSDTEYPPPPPSPSKINRSRIKAIPRLSYRKTSFSASESEDESRRNFNRNRNDSVCSTASGVTESVAECMSPQRPKEYNSIIQKKCNRTEQSRKLAEARREFQRRFGTTKPDRQRLTMIDLIFYNPTSNPMLDDVKSKQDKEECVPENVDISVDNESEKIDDPEVEENAGDSDEENEMPVPQMKVGPSGEIILDEKSLVVESKQVKRQREELQKTQLVDGDFNTSYGIYKRQKRAKNWTQSETLRFYKALNTIGSDFALMCELFPRRTRRELKMKFKKEERINRTLINKAIMEPCSFDFTELKHEVDAEEKELEEIQKQKEYKIKLKKQRIEEKMSRKRKVSKEEDTDEPKQVVRPLEPKLPKIRKIRKPKIKKLSIESVLEDSDADESDIATQSESEDEISMPLRPTRSGRIPKVAKKFDNTESVDTDCIIKTNKVSEDIKKNSVEPGSIMIMTEKGLNGEPVYKIYMVTPDQNATPLNLTSEVVSKAIEFKKGLTAKNIMTISANVTEDEADNATTVFEENNITIPADETVTTLKDDKCISITNEKDLMRESNEEDTSKKDNNSLVENSVSISGDELTVGSRKDEHG